MLSKKNQTQLIFQFILLLTIPLLFLSGCHKIDRATTKKEIHKPVQDTDLDFLAENKTDAPIYITCFYYAQRRDGTRWSWHKTPVMKIDKNKQKLVHFNLHPKPENINHIYGYIGLFDNEIDAENSIFELLTDKQKVDLGLINNLDKHKVTFYTEEYGVEGKYNYFIFQPDQTGPTINYSLPIENTTGEDLYVTLFTYEKDEGESQWNFDKYDVVLIKDKETKHITIDNINWDPNDYYEVRGFLGIFEKKDKETAENSTFETLYPNQKVVLGKLMKLVNKKIVLLPRKYGLIVGFSKNQPIVELEFKEVTLKESNLQKIYKNP